MTDPRTSARFAGILFLTAIVAAIGGGVLIETVVPSDGTLPGSELARSTLGMGVALEYLNGLAVVGIGALLYPLIRSDSESLAAGYLGFRVAEAVLYLFGATLPLLILGSSFGDDPSGLALMMALRSLMMELAVPVLLSAGGLILYYWAFRANRLPRFLSVWGMVAVILVSIGNIWTWGAAAQAMLVLPILLNEVVLGFWLIAKGFDLRETGEPR